MEKKQHTIRIQTKEYAQKHLLPEFKMYLIPHYTFVPYYEDEDSLTLMKAGIAQKNSPEAFYLTKVKAICKHRLDTSLASILFYTYGLIIDSLVTFKLEGVIYMEVEFKHELLIDNLYSYSVTHRITPKKLCPWD